MTSRSFWSTRKIRHVSHKNQRNFKSKIYHM